MMTRESIDDDICVCSLCRLFLFFWCTLSHFFVSHALFCVLFFLYKFFLMCVLFCNCVLFLIVFFGMFFLVSFARYFSRARARARALSVCACVCVYEYYANI